MRNKVFRIEVGHKGDMWFLVRDVRAHTENPDKHDVEISKIFFNEDKAEEYLHTIRTGKVSVR